MPFYIAEVVGSGTDEDPFRPFGVDDLPPGNTTPNWTAIYLKSTNRCLVGVREGLSLSGSGTAKVADSSTEEVKTAARNRISSDLGVDLAATRFGDIVAELLIDHARTDGTRWPPLRAGRDGSLRIFLGGEEIWTRDTS